MGILTIILAIALFLAVSYLFLTKRELDALKRQLVLMQELDTNKQLLSSFQDKDIVALIDEMNHFIQLKKNLERENYRQNKSLKEMVLNMSHDLRTPLTSIRGYMVMLGMAELSEEKKQKYIQIINDKIMVLNDLISRFFELSKVESEDYQLELAPIDLKPLLAEALALYYPDFQACRMEVNVELAPELSIIGNAEALTRIFQNLLDNMIKHKSLAAAVCGEVQKDKILLRFRSKTPAFDTESLPLLFDKFYVTSASNPNVSTGLGLAIVKELTEKMSGTVKALYEDGWLTIIVTFAKH